MSVQELSDLSLRYVRLTNRFKAAWTFHQFLQGLDKVFSGEVPGGDTVAFQSLFTELKGISKKLTASQAAEVEAGLDDTARRLEDKFERLIELDALLTPSRVRQFFDRVHSDDDRVLTQIVRFYLFVCEQHGWDPDRVDKMDFLVTRLAELLKELDRPALERDPLRAQMILSGFWRLLGAPEPDPSVIEDTQREVRTLREAMAQIQSLEEFNQLGVIRGYRQLKHGLERLFFHPEILAELVETNLFLRSVVGEFYGLEERRLASDCREAFDLERDALERDASLAQELRELRGDLERWEQEVESENVKLGSVVELGQRVRSLLPRLRSGASGDSDQDHALAEEGTALLVAGSEQPVGSDPPARNGDARAPSAVPSAVPSAAPLATGGGSWDEGLPAAKPRGPLQLRTAHGALLADTLRRLLGVLEGMDWEASPRTATQTPEARTLRLEPREVLAFRRLFNPQRFEAEREQFLLEAAALRLAITAEAEEIVGSADHLRGRRSATALKRARDLCHLAGFFVRRFEQFFDEAVHAEDLMEAKTLQHVRMRLVRDYSGLWLLVFG
ncbi:MAG TPA: hypothetical protein VMV46_17835 [Thermoanaerobaculia bacterium]|nr:hypothetical protein [Thermoanaerobaculia bacterium]